MTQQLTVYQQTAETPVAGDGWLIDSVGTVVQSTARAHTGTHCWRLTIAAGNNGAGIQAASSDEFITVAAGQTVVASGWYWVTAAGPRWVEPKFNWYTAGAYTSTVSQGNTLAAGSWQFYSTTFTVPAGVDKGQFIVGANTAVNWVAGETLDFDDMSVDIPAVVVPPKYSTVSDDFNDNAYDPTLWPDVVGYINEGGANYVSAITATEKHRYSKPLDFTPGGYCQESFGDLSGLGSGNAAGLKVFSTVDSTQQLKLYVKDGTLKFAYEAGGTDAGLGSVAYSAASMQWLQIARDSATGNWSGQYAASQSGPWSSVPHAAVQVSWGANAVCGEWCQNLSAVVGSGSWNDFTTSQPVGIARPEGGSWTLFKSDDFLGSTLNSAMWVKSEGPGGVGDGQTGWGNLESYYDSQVTLANSIATLTMIPGGPRGYKSGSISGKGKFVMDNTGSGARSYYVESLIKVPPASDGSLWPAWWSYGNSWPNEGEVDNFEFGYDGSGGLGGSTNGLPALNYHSAAGNLSPNHDTYGVTPAQGVWCTYGTLVSINAGGTCTITPAFNGALYPAKALVCPSGQNPVNQHIIWSHQTLAGSVVSGSMMQLDWVRVWH